MCYRPTLFDINRVFLILGWACNFNCPHCVQHDSHPKVKKSVQPKVLEYLQRLADSRPERMRVNLTFFGGEPLLYKTAMKETVQTLGDRFKYTIISNGSLLFDEDVEWINENNIGFVFSNDGFYTKCTRDLNLFDDPAFVGRFNRIEDRSVEGVFHAYNSDIYKFWSYVQGLAPGTKVYLDDLICSSSVPDSYQYFNVDEIRLMFKQIKEDHIQFFNHKAEANAAVEYLLQKIRAVGRIHGKELRPRCGTCRSMLNIDTAGNVYLCHNSDEIVGTIDDDIIDLFERGQKKIEEKMQALIKARTCEKCSVFGLCRGGCPLESPVKNCGPLCDVRRIQWKTAQECFEEFLKLEGKQ